MNEYTIIAILLFGITSSALVILLIVAFKLRGRFLRMDQQFEQLVTVVNRVVHQTEREAILQMQNAVSLSHLPFKFPVFLDEASIDAFHARALILEILIRKPKVVLELGSGSSSVIIALALKAVQKENYVHYAVDHDDFYLGVSKDLAEANDVLDYIQFHLCPLAAKESTQYPWYSGIREIVSEGQLIELLIVDGPPAYLPGTAESRAPALPELYDLLASKCTIILDDANREPERQIAEEWARKFPEFSVTHYSHGKGVAILRRETQ